MLLCSIRAEEHMDTNNLYFNLAEKGRENLCVFKFECSIILYKTIRIHPERNNEQMEENTNRTTVNLSSIPYPGTHNVEVHRL